MWARRFIELGQCRQSGGQSALLPAPAAEYFQLVFEAAHLLPIELHVFFRLHVVAEPCEREAELVRGLGRVRIRLERLRAALEMRDVIESRPAMVVN